MTPLTENPRAGGVEQNLLSQEGWSDIWEEKRGCRTDNRKSELVRDGRRLTATDWTLGNNLETRWWKQWIYKALNIYIKLFYSSAFQCQYF